MTLHLRQMPMLPPSSSKLLPRRAGQATPPHFRRDQVYAKRFKRILDLTFITLALIVSGIFLVPVMAVITLLIAMDGGKPIYTQKRLGRGGRVYEIYKFRTMVRDAEAQLEKHLKANPEARAEWDAHQKLVVDPRITRIGRILRKTSLDELPQLLNVIKGDMSLVGPRPMMADQRALYEGEAYFAMRPGITGSWQVSDRHASHFSDRVGFDDQYHQDLSLKTDVKILMQTVMVVLRGTGC